MFDPQTTELIHRAPHLPELDLERLPQEFTKAFASIVSFRIRLTEEIEVFPEELSQKMDELRRLAATFEGFVALQSKQVDRRAAAFVAAEAYQLLNFARTSVTNKTLHSQPFSANAIAPEVSALLLFLIANQPSDAMEMARSLSDVRPPGNAPSIVLIDALSHLAAGRLREISNLSERVEMPSPNIVGEGARH